MRKNLLDFTDFNSFYCEYRPLTPCGRQVKTRRPFYTDKEDLLREYDLIDDAVDFIKGDPEEAVRVEYHLRRIPELPPLPEMTPPEGAPGDSSLLNAADCYQIKKFLLNYKEVAKMLPGNLKKKTGLLFSSDELLNLLSPDRESAASFYISSAYSPELARIRTQIKKMDRELAASRHKKLKEIQRKTGFDFSSREFLVVKESEALGADRGCIFIEPYDSSHAVVKPVLEPDYFELRSGREELLKQEKSSEADVLRMISNSVSRDREKLELYSRSIAEADTALARARLALRYDMVRPGLRDDERRTSIRKGRYVPMEAEARDLGTPYQPVSADFDGPVIVVTGSNMGGKTVLLKSLLFFQVLTQSGFFVPAEAYETVLFDRLLLIGDPDESSRSGLSSFGQEIFRLTECEEEKRTLFIIDEFARTTNAVEGKALLSALLKRFSEKKEVSAFVTTHFSALPTFKGVSRWRMKGLNYTDYKQYYHKDFNSDLDERIRLINSYMDYQVIPDKGDSPCRDALKIADILGLDSRIINYAGEFLESEKE